MNSPSLKKKTYKSTLATCSLSGFFFLLNQDKIYSAWGASFSKLNLNSQLRESAVENPDMETQRLWCKYFAVIRFLGFKLIPPYQVVTLVGRPEYRPIIYPQEFMLYTWQTEFIFSILKFLHWTVPHMQPNTQNKMWKT